MVGPCCGVATVATKATQCGCCPWFAAPHTAVPGPIMVAPIMVVPMAVAPIAWQCSSSAGTGVTGGSLEVPWHVRGHQSAVAMGGCR